MSDIHYIELHYKENDILSIFQSRKPGVWSGENIKRIIKPVLLLAIIVAFCAFKLHSDYATGYVVGMVTSLLLIGMCIMFLLIEWCRDWNAAREFRAYAKAMEGKQVGVELSNEKITLVTAKDRKSHEWTSIAYAAINADFILLDFKGPQQIFPSTLMSTTDFKFFYDIVQQKIPGATVTP